MGFGARDYFEVKTLPHLFMLRVTSSPLQKSKNRAFFPPSFFVKNLVWLTKELNRQQVFLVEKGFAA